MRSLSSPASRGSAAVVGPAAVLFCIYLSLICWEGSMVALSAFFVFCGILFLMASIMITFGFMELKIDTIKYTWTEQLNIFNWRFAPETEAIPDGLNYILIFDSAYTFGNASDDIQRDSIYFYEVSLVYNDNRKKVFTLTAKHSMALKTAHQMQVIFNLEITDKTIDSVQY